MRVLMVVIVIVSMVVVMIMPVLMIVIVVMPVLMVVVVPGLGLLEISVHPGTHRLQNQTRVFPRNRRKPFGPENRMLKRHLPDGFLDPLGILRGP